MALRVQNTIVVDDSRVLSNVTGLKTINGNQILGTGNVVIETDLSYEERSNNMMLTASDKAKFIDITSNSFNQTIDVAANLGPSWWCYIRNSGNGDIELNTTSSELLNGLNLSSELIVGGGFDSAGDWLLDTNWSISGSKLIAANASTSQFARPMIPPLTTNNTYVVSFDVKFYPGFGPTNLDVDFAQNSSPTLSQQSIVAGLAANGTYTYTHFATKSGYTIDTIIFSGGSSEFLGEIDNVSVKQVQSSTGFWYIPDTQDIIITNDAVKLNLFNYTATTLPNAVKQNNVVIPANTLVELTFDVSDYVGNGYLNPVLGVRNDETILFRSTSNISANGTHTVYISTTNANANVIGFVTYAGTDGVGQTLGAFNAHISNISAVYKSTNVDQLSYPLFMYTNESRLLMSNGTTLRTEVVSPFRKVYMDSGSFFKPSGYDRFGVFAVGGGGGGAKTGTSATGGKGGDLVITTVQVTEPVVSITVGAGGAPGTGSSNTSGGNTRFGQYAVAFGARAQSGLNAYTTETDNLGQIYLQGTLNGVDTATIAPTGGGNRSASTTNNPGGRNRSVFGVADNGGGILNASGNNGTSVDVTKILAGGTGGGAAHSANTAGNGGFPGGGGGAANTGTAGAGADGVLVIWGEK